ncbi:MAG: hypothetical protein ACREC6_13815 [Hyphomicrobiaceae bacterium]
MRRNGALGFAAGGANARQAKDALAMDGKPQEGQGCSDCGSGAESRPVPADDAAAKAKAKPKGQASLDGAPRSIPLGVPATQEEFARLKEKAKVPDAAKSGGQRDGE